MDTYLLCHVIPPLGKKFLENTLVHFLVCSTFPRWVNRNEGQFRVNWVALHYRFRRQNWLFVFTLPRIGIQFIVFEAHSESDFHSCGVIRKAGGG